MKLFTILTFLLQIGLVVANEKCDNRLKLEALTEDGERLYFTLTRRESEIANMLSDLDISYRYELIEEGNTLYPYIAIYNDRNQTHPLSRVASRYADHNIRLAYSEKINNLHRSESQIYFDENTRIRWLSYENIRDFHRIKYGPESAKSESVDQILRRGNGRHEDVHVRNYLNPFDRENLPRPALFEFDLFKTERGDSRLSINPALDSTGYNRFVRFDEVNAYRKNLKDHWLNFRARRDLDDLAKAILAVNKIRSLIEILHYATSEVRLNLSENASLIIAEIKKLNECSVITLLNREGLLFNFPIPNRSPLLDELETLLNGLSYTDDQVTTNWDEISNLHSPFVKRVDRELLNRSLERATSILESEFKSEEEITRSLVSLYRRLKKKETGQDLNALIDQISEKVLTENVNSTMRFRY